MRLFCNSALMFCLISTIFSLSVSAQNRSGEISNLTTEQYRSFNLEGNDNPCGSESGVQDVAGLAADFSDPV